MVMPSISVSGALGSMLVTDFVPGAPTAGHLDSSKATSNMVDTTYIFVPYIFHCILSQ